MPRASGRERIATSFRLIEMLHKSALSNVILAAAGLDTHKFQLFCSPSLSDVTYDIRRRRPARFYVNVNKPAAG